MDDKRRFRQSVHLWWNGEYKVHDADMYFEQRWTSRACHSVVDYLRRHHWKLIMALGYGGACAAVPDSPPAPTDCVCQAADSLAAVEAFPPAPRGEGWAMRLPWCHAASDVLNDLIISILVAIAAVLASGLLDRVWDAL